MNLGTQQTTSTPNLIDAKALVYESIQLGNETLTKLGRQEEKLNQIQDNLEANNAIVDKSATLLRNMTWSGYMYNSCVQISNTIKTTPYLISVEKKTTNISNIIENPPVIPPSPSKLVQNDIPTVHGSEPELKTNEEYLTLLSTAPSIRNIRNYKNEAEEKHLAEISSAVAQLQDISVIMGEHLDRHNKAIDEAETLTETLTEKTLFVTLRTSKLTARVSGKHEQIFIGKFQFINSADGKFLSVYGNHSTQTPLLNNVLNEDTLVLKSIPDRSTYFNCFASNDGSNNNIFGIQNEKTLKFIGCSMWGTVLCGANYFGTQEECFLDLSGEETGILFLARNWGSGGWLLPNEKLFVSSSGVLVEMLNSTTLSIHDKKGMAMFRALPEEFGVRLLS